MKNIVCFVFLLFFIPRLSCQDKPLTIKNKCTIEKEAHDFYLKDARQLVLQYIIDEEPPEKDEIEIPQAHVERVLGYLAAVYNAVDSLPAANKVVNIYKVHDSSLYKVNDIAPYSMDHIAVCVDINNMWARTLLAGDTPTGNSDADKLINTYNLKYNSSYKTKDESVYLVYLKTDKLLNTQALSDAFEAIEGVVSAEPDIIFGDGSHIEMSGYGTDEVTLTYNYGWGDCPAGCINRHYWTFTVDENCKVTYQGSSGRLPR